MNGKVWYRPGLLQVCAVAGVAGVCLAAAVAIHPHGLPPAHPPGHAVRWHVFLRLCGQAVVGWLAGVSVTALGTSVELRADEMVVRGPVTRRIPRGRVTAVDVRSWCGTRHIFVHHAGTRTRLPAPTPFLDRRFEAKFREIMAWAAGYR